MSEQRYAGQACSSCKERKRKCDKRLPKCSLCNRKNWNCGYSSGDLLRRPVRQIRPPVSSSTIEATESAPQTPPSPQVKHSFSSDDNDLQLRIQQINFPRVLFMDRQVSDQFQVEIPRANFSTPAYVLGHIGDFDYAHETSSAFFDTTHTWMPIIFRISFFKTLPSSIGQIREDYALLLLCMGLMRWRLSDPAEHPQNAAYIAAKRFFLELELVGVVSIQVLQAGILLALYEIGHAIYPSAFISVATCARYTQALGIDWKSKAHQREAFSWVEVEERNRVRWAVVLLDRAINIGCPNRSTLLPDPDPTTLLPVDDAAWNNETMPTKPPAQVSSPSSDSMGRFALIAQATCLFAQVLRHINSPCLDKELLREEALLLDRALNSLRSLLDVLPTAGTEPQKIPFLSQTTICAIALMLLHEFHADQGIESSPSFDTVHHAQIMTEATICGQEKPLNDADGMRMCVAEASVFLPTLFYQTAVTNLRLHYEESERSEKSRKAVDSMKIALEALDGRWRSGGVYLKILEARELRYMRLLNLI